MISKGIDLPYLFENTPRALGKSKKSGSTSVPKQKLRVGGWSVQTEASNKSGE